MPDPSRPHVLERSAPLARAAAALAAALAAPGCTSLSDIDRRVEALIARDNSRLDGGSIIPGQRRAEESDTPRSILTDKEPASVNPPADQIPFTPGKTLTVRQRLDRLDSYSALRPDARVISLEEALLVAQRSAPEFLAAEEQYILAAIQLLIQRHLWGPRFFNDTALTLSSNPQDLSGGNYQTALNVINTLRATQRLPYGGQAEARFIVNATRQLSDVATADYTQAAQIVLTANVPLLRGAGLIAQEDLIQAERNLVYAARSFEDFRRTFLVTVSRDYFDLVRSQRAVENQAERLVSLRRQQAETDAKVEAGRQSAFDARNVQQSVLSGEIAQINERERFLVALDRFKIRLGIPVDEALRLAPATLLLPEPDISPTAAGEIATRLRLDLQNRRDQSLDSRRAVDNARNQTLPDLNLTGTATFNTNQARDVGRLNFNENQTGLAAGATLSLPLDRDIENANVRSALIAWQRSLRDLRVFEDGILVDARAAVREIDRARFQLDLAEQSVQINLLRQEELELKSDTTITRDRLDAQNDLLQARLTRDSADRDLRIAILNYLQVTGQMRVSSEGRFQPLQGMLVNAESREGGAMPNLDQPAPGAPAGDLGIPAWGATRPGQEQGPPPQPENPPQPPSPPQPQTTPDRNPTP